MAVAEMNAPKGLAVDAPLGGISAQIGSESYALVLRNGEIERFEEHRIGLFQFLDQLLKNEAKVSHCRDIVALGLVGAGKSDVEADALIAEIPPHANIALRGVARDLVFAAFTDPDAVKKKDETEVGSSAPESNESALTPKSA